MSPPFVPADLWLRLPAASHCYVAALLADQPVEVRLSRPRKTKLGDHRGPVAGRLRHRISVNEDLNPYALLTTLLHEIAHAAAWELHRTRRRRLRPHGPEWKAEFERLLQPVVAGAMLPEDIREALSRSMRDPAAATCTDRELSLALARYDAAVPGLAYVESLPVGAVFRTDGGRVFRLGPRLRSRFLCVEQRTGCEYRMHGLCRVEPVAVPAAAG